MNQEQALDILKAGENVFLTGSAGTGKTYVLNQYINYLRNNAVSVGITASTGIAATHINGMTIHAWSGIGINDTLSQEDLERLTQRQQLCKRLRKTQVLIIDEVSMIAAHVIDLVDRVCRHVRTRNEPFGGLQVVLCGDFFQLPPVTQYHSRDSVDVSDDDPFFAAEASAFRQAQVRVCYLDTQYRHNDDALTAILNALRSGDIDENIVRSLRRRIGAPLNNSSVVPTRLYTHNVDVDAINAKHLQALETEGRRYVMSHYGREHLAQALMRSCLAPQELVLRIGAAIMFVKNNFEEGYANGTLGTVIRFDQRGFPVVQTTDERVIVVEPVAWDLEEDGTIIAGIKQVPLRLAWAITVHKSQGMTLDAAVIDLSKSFVSGMGYVALSRVRSLKTLSLVGFNDRALMIDQRVRALDDVLRIAGEEAEAWVVAQKEAGVLVPAQMAFLARTRHAKKRPTLEVTHSMVAQGMTVEAIARARSLTPETIISHIERLQKESAMPVLDMTQIRAAIDDAVFTEIATILAEDDMMHLAPAYRKLNGLYTYDQIRLVRLCLNKNV